MCVGLCLCVGVRWMGVVEGVVDDGARMHSLLVHCYPNSQF